MDRRRWLKLSAAGMVGLFAPPAFAFGEATRFAFGQLGRPDPYRGGAWTRLALELSQRTSVTCQPRPTPLSLEDAALFRHPFLILSGESLPPWTDDAWQRLHRYLGAGGFLFLDGSRPGDPLVQQAYDRLSRRFSPESQLRLDREHVLFRSFYLLDRPMGRLPSGEPAKALVQDGRLAVVATEVDLAGALARDAFGAWSFDLPRQDREQAVRFGVNLVMYSLCTDYKADQVHIPFLLKRRR